MGPIEHVPGVDDAASPAAGEAVDVVAARHPIYDDRMRVAAYELKLHSRDDDGTLREGHGEASPAAVAEIADSLVATHPVHVKVGRDVVAGGEAHLLPADRIVLEVPPGTPYDADLATAMRSLGRTGHAVVLDGFRFSESSLPVLKAARAVKLDAGIGPDALAREVALVREHHPQAALIATGVDNHERLADCRELGFSLFQGFFFLEPELDAGQAMRPSQLARMRLIARLQDDDPDFDGLQEVISLDIWMSYALLRFINSAIFALPRKVESVRDAAVLLGTTNVRRWATLTVLAHGQEGKPSELMVTALTRARMCELLAPAFGDRDGSAFFTTGLFSVVDALMDVSMIEVLASLPFSEEINRAILNFEGPKGAALRAAVAWERANLSELAPPPGLSVSDVGETYRDAVTWAAEASAGLG
jgi:c-di-GMP-related signal transduction protein